MTRNVENTDGRYFNDDATPDATDATPADPAFHAAMQNPNAPATLEYFYTVSILTDNGICVCKTKGRGCHGQCAVPRATRDLIHAEMVAGECDEFDLEDCCIVYIHRGHGFVTVWEAAGDDSYRIIAAARDGERYDDDEPAAQPEPAAADEQPAPAVVWVRYTDTAYAVADGGLYVVGYDPEDDYRTFFWQRLNPTKPLRDLDHYRRAARQWKTLPTRAAHGGGFTSLEDAITAAEAHALGGKEASDGK